MIFDIFYDKVIVSLLSQGGRRMSVPDPVDREQERQHELYQTVMRAVEEADRIILDASDGAVEETRYLTACVAREFAKKVFSDILSDWQSSRLEIRFGDEEIPGKTPDGAPE